jgi:hypothetical protein
MKENDIIQSAIAALKISLDEIPFLQIEQMQVSNWDNQPDITVKIRIKGDERDLVVGVKNQGQPRTARIAIYQIKDHLRQRQNAYGILVAPFISPETGKIIEESGIGYLDLAGNCFISFDTIFIRKTGIKNNNIQKRMLRSLYSPKGERILRVLLNQPKRIWRTMELAQTADVSLGQVANIKKLLLDREWLLDTHNGMTLTNPSALLDEWSQSYNFQRNRAVECYVMAEIPEIEVQVAETCRRLGLHYALTGFSSAARIAPMVRYQKASVYISGDSRSLVETLSWKVVPSGSNISLLLPYDEGVYLESREVDSITIVSPVQTYLDLKSVHGRGQEAAEAVHSALEKTW